MLTREEILDVVGREGHVIEEVPITNTTTFGGFGRTPVDITPEKRTPVRIPPKKHRPLSDDPEPYRQSEKDVIEELFKGIFG